MDSHASDHEHSRWLKADQPTESELRGLFRFSLELLCVAGGDGYFKRVNPAFERTLGYTAQELRARPFVEFVHPEDRETTRRAMSKLAEGTPVIQFENRYQCRDGSYRWLSWMAVPHDDGDRIYATASDVTLRKTMETELRANEERLRLLIESSPDAMVVVDADGSIVLVNAKAESLFGYRRDELLGQTVELLVPQALRRAHAAERAAYRANPQARTMGGRPNLTGRRKDGSEFPAEIALSPIDTRAGLLVYAAVRDLTERMQLEQTLREQMSQLLAARRIQEHLLPKGPPSLPGFDIAGAVFPAQFAAGDHFDFPAMPNQCLGVVVADVAGHGVGPAMVMASTHAYLRLLAAGTTDVESVLSKTNRIVTAETDTDFFVTAFLACLDPGKRTLWYSNAGHPAAHVFDALGKVRAALPSTSLPLGIVPNAEFPAGRPVTLLPGDIVLICTDGLLETMSPDGDCFGQPRVDEVVARNSDAPAADIIGALNEALSAFSGRRNYADDVTMVVVKVDAARP